MSRSVLFTILALAGLVAFVVSEPAPKGHHFWNNVKTAVRKVEHKIAPKMGKLMDCLKRTPGLSQAMTGVVSGCASSASGGMGAVAACAARKGAIPAARATSHLAVCMG